MKMSKRFWNLSGSMLAFLVVLCIAIAVNVILANVRIRKDLTQEGLYTLSQGSRNVLAKLTKPVTLKFYFNESSPEVPMNLKTYARHVEDLLKEYEIAGNGKITIEKYDPKPDSDAEEWAQRYGLSGQSVGFMGPTVYLGLVAVCGDAESTLPVLDPRAENTLEYSITRTISRIASPSKPVIGVMSSLPVLGSAAPPYPMPNQPPRQEAWFAFTDLREDYKVRQVETTAESIDKDIDALILVHPKDLSDATLYALDQFVLRGGKLLAFLDPLCVAEAETQPTPGMQFNRTGSDLPKLLKAWGVTYDPKQVVVDLQATSMLRMGEGGQVEESPVWLSLRGKAFNAQDILTSRLDNMMLPYAGAFNVDSTADMEATPLITSSEVSSLTDAMTAQYSLDTVRRSFKSGLRHLDLAVRLHGKLKTAFPDGKPGQNPADTNAVAAASASLTQSVDTSTVILVSDVDMLYDRFCVQDMNFFGYKAHQPINDNLTFFDNAVEQISGSADLVSIRSRGKSDRSFDVVADLARRAQERYVDEESALQQKLEQAQQRVSELQSKKDASERFILSPQQKKEIEGFQDQVIQTKQQLKLVRRKLREDIDRLGVKVKVINILLMPLLVAAAGIALSAYRRRKTRRTEPPPPADQQ